MIMVAGTKAHADALWDEVADVIAPLGLRLSVNKTRVCHLDEGFDFLGFRIQRRRKKGTNKTAVYTYPSKKALLSILAKVRALTKKARHHGLADLLGRLNPVLRGWCGISVTVCRKRPSDTSMPSSGIGSPGGCSSGTSESRGRSSSGGS